MFLIVILENAAHDVTDMMAAVFPAPLPFDRLYTRSIEFCALIERKIELRARYNQQLLQIDLEAILITQRSDALLFS